MKGCIASCLPSVPSPKWRMPRWAATKMARAATPATLAAAATGDNRE
eukprot:CAMPEP_0177551636 /NCGR_PEP_ID=MMETSP0369-20130122/66306_1 /TAXON_ID=447022 ORGANISM="Scrippsiella hangoei-like, Strain SHHI-4" /NCGR_SAMPLE_ID=MMETSP0369 /ASSEMBLY_ACC=CAM_ASM_000364 /LENGTH=46 /DNA_ID=CAMNT_0019037107 /DNA_START=81 /DNA_END=218 /DNA_ORIENTATION=+